ncbi:ABC transporter permease [Pseudomarimonas arenosa]|uniref:ABC transporter permease n=1 Tax=Pseudomarimonas arenosa TaxID=2774145 RepID=A0AAW3ZSW0_9GAMM|nr:FtsX-like permease family protein [Pseudomarimonas arenosa]MBD8528107.1 ABC transporter permease [Pseudomarimonas arenosa]
MRYFRLVWASLWRKKTRAILTLLSLISAFLLFGLLQALGVFFTAGADFVGASRLIVQSRVSFTQSLPMSMLPEIESIPGVKAINHDQWFGGMYGENQQVFTFATDPARLRVVYPEWVLSDEEWKAFETTRTGAIVGRKVAEQYGFKVGQKLPLKSNIFPQKDGSMAWSFDIVGIYDGIDQAWQAQTQGVYIHSAYFNEANQFGPMAGTFTVLLDDVDQANAVAQAIDARFLNSPNETKTQSEKDFNKGFFAQIGDIGLIVQLILMAVFFTILLLTGNTMAQAVRERIPELAVLKTLGFSDAKVTALVLVEALFLCMLGGLIGMGLAALMITGLAQAAPGFFGAVRANETVWMQALLAMFVLALAVGLPPALKAGRIRIVDALAGR